MQNYQGFNQFGEPTFTMQFESKEGTVEVDLLNAPIPGGQPKGTTLFVDMTNGLDTNTGKSWSQALKTIQAAIDLTVDKAGTDIYITGSGTGTTSTTEGIIINKENVRLIGFPINGAITGTNASITNNIGFGAGDISEGNLAVINITKSKVSIEGLRINNTHADYPCGIQSLASVNSQLSVKNCLISINGGNTGRAIKFRTAASGSTFENLHLYGGAASKMNNGIIFEAGSTKCVFKNIHIHNTEGQGIYNAGSVGDIFENIYTFPTCATGLEIVGITTMCVNCRIMGAAKVGAAHTAIMVGCTVAADV